MFCSNCGKNVPDDIRFCPACGAEIVILDKQTESMKEAEKELVYIPAEIPITTPQAPELVESKYREPGIIQPELHNGEYTKNDRKDIKKSIAMIIIGFVAMVACIAIPLYIHRDAWGFDLTNGFMVKEEDVDSNEEFEKKEDSAEEADVEEQLTELIKTYTSAYYSGDVGTVAKMVTPFTDSEKDYCHIIGEFFDGYENGTGTFRYVEGVKAGEYVLCFSANIVSSYTETVLPVFGYLYIETDSDGELYINNLYSSFNVSSGEVTENWDDSKYNAISEYTNDEEIQRLYQDWYDRYEQACEDEMINDILDKISEALQ